MTQMPDPATRDRLLEGLAAGVAATLIMTGLALSLPAFGGPALPRELVRALHLLADHPLWLVLALAAHFSYGGLAGAVYFGGARRVTVGGGALFGGALWGLAMALYAPLVGLGFVASERPQLALLSLPAHLIYGMALAAFAPRGEITQTLGASRAERGEALRRGCAEPLAPELDDVPDVASNRMGLVGQMGEADEAA